jgi:hypothetical protein
MPAINVVDTRDRCMALTRRALLTAGLSRGRSINMMKMSRMHTQNMSSVPESRFVFRYYGDLRREGPVTPTARGNVRRRRTACAHSHVCGSTDTGPMPTLAVAYIPVAQVEIWCGTCKLVLLSGSDDDDDARQVWWAAQYQQGCCR